MKKFLKRSPRILAILFILFLMMFSLDIFGQGYTFRQTVTGLFMHNIPSIILTIILIISWKHELVGAVAFIIAGLGYILITSINQIDRQTQILRSLIIAGPALLTGILFRLSWKRKE